MKILLPISLIVLIFIVISTNLASSKNDEINDLNELKDGILLATTISQVLHSIQKERGLSSGYISSGGTKFKLQLDEQRIITDAKVIKLNPFLKKIKNTMVKKYLHISLYEFSGVKKLREEVNGLSINSTIAIAGYTKINIKFLKTIKGILKISKIPSITKTTTSYVNFLYAKDTTGLERAVGTMILANDGLNPSEIFRFNQLIAIEKLYIENFYENATWNEKEFYNNTLKNTEIDEIENIRQNILNILTTGDSVIKQHYWFKLLSTKIDNLKLIDDYLSEKTITDINQRTDKAYSQYLILNIINILSIISFIILVWIVYKVMKKEKILKDITDKYIINSTTDTKGIITYASEAFCNISGYTKEELIGKPHNITRHPDMPASIFKEMWKTISKGERWTGQIKNLKKDGGYYWVYANIEPIYDNKGKIKSYVAIRLDITNSKQLEQNIKSELEKNRLKDQQLMQQSRLAQMGEMLAMIAHQWRQPLAAISATSGSLELKAKLNRIDKETVIRLSKNISNYAQHLSSTIDDFRDFFKSEKEKKNISLSQVVESVLGIVQVSIENQNISIITNSDSHNVIYSYPNELRQVILNLIKNAEDVLVEKDLQNPYIKITTYTQDLKEILEVSDNGGGIDAEIINKIFDPYFSTKLEKNGSGLGLYMSKTIIEEHCHGNLSVSNNEHGAVFKIVLDSVKNS